MCEEKDKMIPFRDKFPELKYKGFLGSPSKWSTSQNYCEGDIWECCLSKQRVLEAIEKSIHEWNGNKYVDYHKLLKELRLNK